MAHTKALGSTKLGRDSAAKRLGVKIHDGGTVLRGQIIIRQRGSKYSEGINVNRGGDDTLYAAKNGTVKFSMKLKTGFDGRRRRATVVSVAA